MVIKESESKLENKPSHSFMYCFQKPKVTHSFAFCSSVSEKQAVKSENMASAVIFSPGSQKNGQKASGHAWTRSNTPKVLRPSRNLQKQIFFINALLQRINKLSRTNRDWWIIRLKLYRVLQDPCLIFLLKLKYFLNKSGQSWKTQYFLNWFQCLVSAFNHVAFSLGYKDVTHIENHFWPSIKLNLWSKWDVSISRAQATGEVLKLKYVNNYLFQFRDKINTCDRDYTLQPIRNPAVFSVHLLASWCWMCYYTWILQIF